MTESTKDEVHRVIKKILIDMLVLFHSAPRLGLSRLKAVALI